MHVIYSHKELPKNILKDIQATCKEYWDKSGEDNWYESIMLHHRNFKKGLRGGNAKVYEELIDFLDHWNCHISKDNDRKKQFRKKIPPIIHHVDRAKLPSSLEAVQIKDLPKISGFFEDLKNIKHIGPTISSKILSLFKPELFMIWDKAICEFYGFADNGVGYSRFMLLMRDFAKELRRRHGNRKQSVEDFLCHDGRVNWVPPIAKYLDEYNWMKITKGSF